MIIDILQQICDFADIHNQITLIGIDKLIYRNIFIRKINKKESFFLIEPYLKKEIICDHTRKLKTSVLKQKKFSKLASLYFRYADIDLTRLMICKTTLTSLDFQFTPNLKYRKSLNKIKNLYGVEFRMNLSNIDCANMVSFAGEVEQTTLNKFMNLQYLDVRNKHSGLELSSLYNIKNTLTTLICIGKFNPIDQKILNELNVLRYLDCTENRKINNIDKFSCTMETLICTGSNICDISKLKKLQKFTDLTQRLHNFENVTNTIRSICCYNIDQESLNKMINLESLKIRGNGHNIINLNHLKNTLTTLDLYYSGKIQCDAIKDLYKIYAFRGHIENIYECPFTRSLRELQDAFINQNELSVFRNLRALYLCNTYKSYNLGHLNNTLKILYAICNKCDDIPKNLMYLCVNYSTINLEDRKYIYEKYGNIFEQCDNIYTIISGFCSEDGENWWDINL